MKQINKQRFDTIWHFGKKYIHMFILAEICILVSYATALILPLKLSELTDNVLYDKHYELLPDIISGYITIFLVATVFNFIYAFVWQYLSNHYVLSIKNTMFEKVMTAKASFLSGMNSGDIMTRIDSDSEQFIHVVQRNLFHFLNSAVMCIGIIVMVMRINTTIALMLIMAAALPIVLTRLCGRFTEKYSKQSREITGQMTGRLYEILKGFREIKLLSAYHWAEKQIVHPLKKLITLGNSIRRIDFLVNKGIYLVNLSASLIIYGFSAYLVADGELTVGVFLAVINYVALLHKKLNWMLRIYLDWFGRKISVDRVNEVLMLEPEKHDGRDIDDIYSIAFDAIHFAYTPENPVLTNVTFRIDKGEKVAIVGESGIGKTTIISLLLGLYPVDSGSILINNCSMSEINPTSLRQKIGVVSQDILLFEDSIRYNLNLGRAYTDSQIQQALQAVGLQELIESLPNGIDTVISPSSHGLSGGQKQRLMIARMLLANPSFIVLDEATSALDVETERVVTAYLDKYAADVTMLIVSHRLEAIKRCDRILVLNKDGIECGGTHTQLLKNCETYCRLFGGEV